MTERFANLMAAPEADVALAEAALLVAAHAYPDLHLAAELSLLDELAASVPEASVDALVHTLFVDHGFAGNRDDYYDPRNSFLNEVVRRRVGIPITLSVLTIDIGRRLGIALDAVSMPGHFLVRDAGRTDRYIDPFEQGALLDHEGCEAAFHSVHGADIPFDASFLAPVGTHAVLARLLANLKAIYRASGDRAALTWVVRLRTLLPGIASDERRDLAKVLAANGHFDQAADELELLADAFGENEHRREAARLRARLN